VRWKWQIKHKILFISNQYFFTVKINVNQVFFFSCSKNSLTQLFSKWHKGKSLISRSLFFLWSQVRTLWLLIWWSLEVYMVINFRARKISLDTYKLTQTLTSIIIKKCINSLGGPTCMNLKKTQALTFSFFLRRK
jgi:hypothetical protein